MSRTRRFFANLGLALAGIVAAFVVAEIGVRAAGLAKPSLYTFAPNRGWGLKPGASGWQRDEGKGFVRVNKWGFRGPDWKLKKPANVFRVAVFGDSFTEAPHVNYDHTFCAVAERELAKCPALKGKRVEVMDFGTDAYGTPQEFMTLENHGWQFSPDLVVLAFFSGNDVRNNSVVLEGDKCRPFYVYNRAGQLVLGGQFDRSRMFWLSCMMRFESRHSQVLNLLGDAKSDLREKIRNWEARPAAPPPSPAPQTQSNPPEAPVSSALKPASLAANAAPSGPAQPHPVIAREPELEDSIYKPPATPVWVDAWRVTAGDIGMMNKSARAHGVPFLAVTLANPPQDMPDPNARKGYMEEVGSTDLFYPDERIKAIGDRDGFAVLNLAPPLQAYAESHHVYLHGFSNTKLGIGHWNAEGHQLAGKLIAQKICAMLSAKAATSPSDSVRGDPK